jgi:hypothetical protein
VVEHLPSNCEAPSSNPSANPPKKKHEAFGLSNDIKELWLSRGHDKGIGDLVNLSIF